MMRRTIWKHATKSIAELEAMLGAADEAPMAKGSHRSRQEAH